MTEVESADNAVDRVKKPEGVGAEAVGDMVDKPHDKALYPGVISPDQLPDTAPDVRPIPWQSCNRGGGRYDIYSACRINPRTGGLLPDFIATVHCKDEADTIRLATKLALINSARRDVEKQDKRPLPLPRRVEFYPQPGGCAVFNSNGLILKDYTSYDAQCTDDTEEKKLIASVDTHNESVIDDLKKRFTAICALEKSQIGNAAGAEYARLEGALRFDDYDDRPKFFSVSQVKTIAALFKQAGRNDLAEIINGVTVGQALWREAQTVSPDQHNVQMLKLEQLMTDGYFTVEEIGTTDEVEKVRAILRQTHQHRSKELLAEMRKDGRFDTPYLDKASAEIKQGLLPDFYFAIHALVMSMAKAGLTLDNSGLQPSEIETIKTMVKAAHQLICARRDRPRPYGLPPYGLSASLMDSSEYKSIFG